MKRRATKCPAETTLQIIGGRWKVLILYQLFQGVKRTSELRRALKGVSQKVLTEGLRELERDRVIEREVFPEVPPRVEYSLTGLGETLRPVIDSMCAWGVMIRDGALEGQRGGAQLTALTAAGADDRPRETRAN